MAEKEVSSLYSRLGFQFDKDKLEQFKTEIKVAKNILLGFSAAAAASAAALFAFTKRMAASIDSSGKLAQTLGIPVNILDQLGYVAQLNGGSIDSLNSSLQSLSKITAQTARGVGAGVEVFGYLGLSATDANGKVKKTEQIFGEVSDAIRRFSSQAEKMELLQSLGINPDMLLTMEQGSQAIAEQRHQVVDLGAVISKDMAKSAAAFNDAWLDITYIVKGFSNIVSNNLMKAFIPFIKNIAKFYKANKKFIKLNIDIIFNKIGNAIQFMHSIMSRIIGVVEWLITALGGLKQVLIVISGILLAMNIKALIIPALIVAVAAALILLFEDIEKYSKGGDSALGNLIEKFPKLKIVVDAVGWTIKKAIEGWSLLLDPEVLSEVWYGIKQMFSDIVSEANSMFNSLLETIKSIAIAILSSFQIDFSSIKESIKSIKDFIFDQFTFIAEYIKKIFSDLFPFAEIKKEIETILEYIKSFKISKLFSGNDNLSNTGKDNDYGWFDSLVGMFSFSGNAEKAKDAYNMTSQVVNNSANSSKQINDNRNMTFNIQSTDPLLVKEEISQILNKQYQEVDYNLAFNNVEY